MTSSERTFKSLKEVFPCVDIRLLKAAAIEYTNDVDAAAEFILREVEAKSPQKYVVNQLDSIGHSCGTDHILDTEPVARLGVQCTTRYNLNGSLDKPPSTGVTASNNSQGLFIDRGDQDHYNNSKDAVENWRLMDQIIVNGEHSPNRSTFRLQPARSTSTESLHVNARQFFALETEEISPYLDSFPRRHSLQSSDVQIDESALVEKETKQFICSDHLEQVGVANDGFKGLLDSIEGVTTSSQDTHLLNFEDHHHGASALAENSGTSSSGGYGTEGTYCDEFSNINQQSMPISEDPLFKSSTVAHSSNSTNSTFLGEFIVNSKNEMNNLLVALDSIADMVDKIENCEARVSEAKVEFNNAGKDTLCKVDDYRHMLKQAREANELYSGEIFGEKSVLSTEAQVLKYRLLKLADERNKQLEIINEINATLERRLALAEQEIAAVEADKQQKLRMAENTLREQELEMIAVQEESKRLQQEFIANSQMREFLVEKGHAVDALQGEIDVIRENVTRLREIVDAGLPLSTIQRSSMSSSSYSSWKSMREQIIQKTDNKEQDPMMVPERYTDEHSSSDGRNSLNDGWELCDNEV